MCSHARLISARKCFATAICRLASSVAGQRVSPPTHESYKQHEHRKNKKKILLIHWLKMWLIYDTLVAGEQPLSRYLNVNNTEVNTCFFLPAVQRANERIWLRRLDSRAHTNMSKLMCAHHALMHLHAPPFPYSHNIFLHNESGKKMSETCEPGKKNCISLRWVNRKWRLN